MAKPSFEVELIDPKSLKRLLVWFGGCLLVLAGMVYLLSPTLFSLWDGFYDNWRDYFLRERIKNTPLFLLLLGTAAFFTSFFISARHPLRDSTFSGVRFKILAVFVVIFILGSDILISLDQWLYFGSPCYDGYCQRASLWRDFVLDPSSLGIEIFHDSLLKSYVGTSWIPPVIIGSLSAIGLPVVHSFMLLNIACWLGCAGILLLIASRHYDFGRLELIVLLIILFGHLGVARSLLFPQTDPFAVLFITLTAACLIELYNNSGLRLYILTMLIMTFGFFIKLSFLPAFAFPFLISVFSRKYEGLPRCKNLAMSMVLTVVPLCLAVSILWISGLDRAFLNELEAASVCQQSSLKFYKDCNPLRFFLVAIQIFQIFPLTLLCLKPRLKYLWHYRLILSMIMIFPAACLFMQTAFWVRYLLPTIPFLALIVTKELIGILGKGRNLVAILTLYVFGNASFLLCKLYY